jgi:hypothetical protein
MEVPAMRKLVLTTVLPVIAIAGLFTAPAIAGGGSFPTQFGDVGVSCGIDPPNPEDTCLYSGYIESPKAKCIPNRRVKMFALVGMAGNPELVDVSKTSKKGAFAGLGRPSDVSAAKFKVTKRVIGSGDKKVVCRAQSLVSA